MRIAIVLLVFLTSYVAFADWTPPSNPDPKLILDEAIKDHSLKNYKDSLAKHIWFHNNALKHNYSLYGVRLSYALLDWISLSKEYPPALYALNTIRNQKESIIKERKGMVYLFLDIVSINEHLGANENTVNLFLWLDKNQPQTAHKVFYSAKASLINAKQYKMCGKYIDPQKDFLKLSKVLQTKIFQITKNTDDKLGNKTSISFAYEDYSNDISLIVAILVQNKRQKDAEKIVKKALLEWNDPKFKKQLYAILDGLIPNPYPEYLR